MSDFEQYFSKLFGTKSVSAYVQEALKNLPSITVDDVTENTRWTLLSKNRDTTFLFPSEKEMEIMDKRLIGDIATVYLVRILTILPTEETLRRRWWICIYRKGTWDATRIRLNQSLKEEGRLVWRTSEVPWIINKGDIRSLGENMEAKICCARNREMTSYDV